MEKQFKTIQKVFWRVPDSNIKKPGDKNLIFCPQCGRSKLQFKSLKSAYNHIKWNSNEIYRENGKAPVRAYWCDDCCCYHVTSKVNSTKYEETEKSRLLDYIKEALTTDNISESRKYIQNAYKIISEESKDTPWAQEMAGKILIAIETINKKEFDNMVKETEYLLRIKNWSASEHNIQWLEEHNLNPEKVAKLRKKLLDSV